MKRGTSRYVDKIFTVVEPYYRSLEAASRFADMAKELGIANVQAIANKVRNAEEEQAIRDYCKKIKLPIAVMIPFDEQVMQADLKGLSIIDYDQEAKVVKALEGFADKLLQ
jgi:CO dehydrogenase maturation factor